MQSTIKFKANPSTHTLDLDGNDPNNCITDIVMNEKNEQCNYDLDATQICSLIKYQVASAFLMYVTAEKLRRNVIVKEFEVQRSWVLRSIFTSLTVRCTSYACWFRQWRTWLCRPYIRRHHLLCGSGRRLEHILRSLLFSLRSSHINSTKFRTQTQPSQWLKR